MANMFLKIDGVDGDATEDGHKKWIVVQHFSWGGSRAADWSAGAGRTREKGTPHLSDMQFGLLHDQAAPVLFQMFTTGDDTKNATLEIMKTGNPPTLVESYKFDSILITSYQNATQDGGAPGADAMAFNFHKLQYKHVPTDEKNKPLSPKVAGYDMATSKAF